MGKIRQATKADTESKSLAMLIAELRKRVDYFGMETPVRIGDCSSIKIGDKWHHFRFVYETTWNDEEFKAGRRYLFLSAAMWGMAMDAQRLLFDDPAEAMDRMVGLLNTAFELAEVEKPLMAHVNKFERTKSAAKGRADKRKQLREERRKSAILLRSDDMGRDAKQVARLIADEESAKRTDGKLTQVTTVLSDIKDLF